MKFFVSPKRENVFHATMLADEIESVTLDYDAYAGYSSTSVSSAAESVETGSVTASTASVSSNVATFKITATVSGYNAVSCLATMANGEKVKAVIYLKVTDVSTVPVTDYE